MTSREHIWGARSRMRAAATIVASVALIGSLLVPTAASADELERYNDIDVPGSPAAAVDEAPTPATAEVEESPILAFPDGFTEIVELGSATEAPESRVAPVEPAPEATPEPTSTSSELPISPTSTPSPSLDPFEKIAAAEPDSGDTSEEASQGNPTAEEELATENSWVEVGDTGLEISQGTVAPQARSNSEVAPNEATIEVTVLSDEERELLGVSGLAVKLERLDSDTPTALTLNVPATVLDGVYGADYASRVQWELLSAGRARGIIGQDAVRQAQEPAVETDESFNSFISIEVSSAPVMLVAAAAAASPTGAGDFTATGLKPSSSWDVSAQTGGFAWTYPLPVPPTPAGMQPDLALSYNSQSVDGKTSSTNNQTSNIGEGWDLSGGGYIERSYVSCAKDDGPSGPVSGKGDLCWKQDNATLSFGSMSGPLIKDATTGAWKLQSDENVRVEKFTGTGTLCKPNGTEYVGPNGTAGLECWRLTSPDGTQYFFGLNQLPGWVSGKAETKSTWTVPVFGNDAGEPCHGSTFASSWCVLGWRWNLDYVVDVHGNAMATYYNAETNLYRANNSVSLGYTRGGSISRIEYGHTSGSIYTTNAATAKVEFGYRTQGRCNASSGCTTQPVSGAATTPATTSLYPDVPYDQNCTSGSCTGLLSPSFWTVAQLQTITTKAYIVGTTSYDTVDTWTLAQTFPDPGDGLSRALWFSEIVHKGTLGSATITEPATQFSGITMQNRVWVHDGLAPLNKYRISAVRLETGATVSANYMTADCQASEVTTLLANAHNNFRRCFPQTWTPQTTVPFNERTDMFHKYVVASTIANPVTGGAGAPAVQTYYDYSQGTPAWRYNDSPFTPEAFRTWSQYAGYDRVTIRVGSPSSPSTQQTTQYWFYRGLDGDRAAPSGGTKSVAVTGSSGVTDAEWFGGRTYQTKVLNGASGAPTQTTVVTPWASSITANDGRQQARFVRDGTTVVTTPVSAGPDRVTQTINSYNTAGFLTQSSQLNEAGALSTCLTNTYGSDNTTAWIIGLVRETKTVGKACGDSPVLPQDHVTATRTYFDGSTTLTAAPSKGLATRTDNVVDYSGTSPVWDEFALMTYDTRGRLTLTEDRIGRKTTTAYVPSATAAAASGGKTSTVITGPAPSSWVSTTTFDPRRGSITGLVDENNRTTSVEYDALGRTVNVWDTDRPKASYPTSPNTKFAYTQSLTAPQSVATTTLTKSTTLTTYIILDGLGREVQTQGPANGGGAKITDTMYDEAGRVISTHNSYWSQATSPSGTLYVPLSPAIIPSRTETTYDGAGRTLISKLVSMGVEHSRTTTSYYGADRVDVDPPVGGTPTSTRSNSLGQVSTLIQYLGETVDPLLGSVTTSYEYDVHGEQSAMVDADGNEWTWTRDVLGQLVEADDPDSGQRLYTYDNAGRQVTAVDARGIALHTEYDEHDRVTKVREGSATGPVLSSYVYDTVAKGQLSSSTAYIGSTAGVLGDAYTTTVNTYDAAYRPTKTTISIPAGAPAFGGMSYSEDFTYNRDGTVNTQTQPSIGGLPSEVLSSTYLPEGLPAGISGSSIYVGQISYSATGLLTGFTRSSGNYMDTAYGYDAATRSRTSVVDRTKISGAWTNTSTRTYTRDLSGNITSSTTTADGVATNKECFTYDYLQNLTRAWTPSSLDCSSEPSASAIGGPAPYYTSWSVDAVTGNRMNVSYHRDDSSVEQSTHDYEYPAPGQPRPHAVSSVTSTTSAGMPQIEDFEYDATGNLISRDGFEMTWDAQGHLSEVDGPTPGSSQENIYDVDGNLLLRDEGGTVTLYLPGNELTSSGGTVTALRTYSFGDASVADRSSTLGVSGSQLRWLSTDIVNTAKTYVIVASGAASTRYSDPYGVEVSRAGGAAAVAWPTTHGYLNAPTSHSTDLSRLGAREYDPSLGRFISVDAVLAPTNPKQNNGYSYSGNNPITFSDSTGDCYVSYYTKCQGPYNPAPKPTSPTNTAPPPPAGVNDEQGVEDVAEPAEAAVCNPGRNNCTNVWDLGIQWLTGTGPKVMEFGEGDPLTEELKEHFNIVDVRNIMLNRVLDGDSDWNGYADHSIGTGIDGVLTYIEDYKTLIQGKPTLTSYLGSYEGTVEIVQVEDGVVRLHWEVVNDSTLSSATHLPFYNDINDFTGGWYQDSYEPWLNSIPEAGWGPMQVKIQRFAWDEDIPLPSGGQY